MKMFRDMLRYRRRLTMGFQVAMAMFAQSKGAASTTMKAPEPKPKSPADQTARYDFTKLLALANSPGQLGQPDRRRDLPTMLDATWQLATQASGTTESAASAATDNFAPKVMSREEARLWLQAYNAGPYALLKYRGNVPYKETQNYAPRVFKYYMENLSSSEYEPYIQQAAKKYGLDPQMIRAIMKTESDFKNSCVSGAGASGLMQVMPAVWSEIKKKYGLEWEYASGVFEPQKNIEVACAYLAWLRYDFLPRHFAEYEANPEAPIALVRDKDRGVPDRQGPRIETASAAAPAPTAAAPIAGTQPAAAAPAIMKPAPQVASLPAVQPAKPAAEQPAKPAAAMPTKRPERITVEVAQASNSGKAQTQTRAGKTIVKVRGTGAATKQPAVAKDQIDVSVASAATAKVTKPNPRTLKKPAVAQADTREEEKRS